jgi:hypothetical protein
LNALQDTHSIPDQNIDEMRASGQQALSKAQFDGLLNLDPVATSKMLADGKWNDQFNADQLQKMEQQAKTYTTAQTIEKNRQDKVKQDAADAAQESAMQAGLKDLYSNKLSTKDILNNPDLDYSHQVQLLNMVERKNKGDLDTDPTAMRNAFAAIVAPDGTPGKITSDDQINKLYIDGQVSLPDRDKLASELDGRKTESGRIESDLKTGVLNVAKQALIKPSGLTGIADPEGEQRYQSFMSWYLNEYQTQRQAGVSATDLTTPGSDKYLGNNIKAFMGTSQDIFNARFGNQNNPQVPSVPTPLLQKGQSRNGSAPPVAGASSPKVTPRLPGESIQSYLSRTSK